MLGIRRWTLLAACLWLLVETEARRKLKRDEVESLKSYEDVDLEGDYDEVEPCQCGVFMSQQVGVKNRRSRPRGPPQGLPVVTYDTDAPSLPCGTSGFKNCISKCLDVRLPALKPPGGRPQRCVEDAGISNIIQPESFECDARFGLLPILKYLPRAGPVICGAVERDVRREKAFLFVKNCGGDWTPTNFSAGKEFCCTDGQHHKC